MFKFPEGDGAGTDALACDYGVVCGLVFPLVVQSVFLQEIGLAHGAGESLGFFFVAQSVTMTLCAAFSGLAEGSGAGHRAGRKRYAKPTFVPPTPPPTATALHCTIDQIDELPL